MPRLCTAILPMMSLILMACLNTIAQAHTYRGPDLGATAQDFALRLEHSDVTLRYGGTDYHGTVGRLGIVLSQQLSPGLNGILSAGYEDISQPDNPDLVGQAPAGYYGGFALCGFLLAGPRIGASVSAHYSYHRLEARPTGQDIVVSWQQGWAQFVAAARLAHRLRLYAGERYGVIDGEQRLSGTVNSSTSFQQDRRVGYFGGLELNVDRTGYIRFQVSSGQFRGVTMLFARRFE